MTRVVVSVGTDHHPFERVLDWMIVVQERLGADVFVQRGATLGRDGLRTVDYVPATELAALMADADAVVCHGGPGTIACARRTGHRPIVIPRNPELGEHVDDHQMRYTSSLAAAGSVDVANTLEQLVELLSVDRPRADDHATSELGSEAVVRFEALIDRLVAGDLPKRALRDRFRLKRMP